MYVILINLFVSYSTVFCFIGNKPNLSSRLQAADLTKPVDKKMYKGTNPTCHDFNMVTMTPDSVSLVVGFSTGQIQLKTMGPISWISCLGHEMSEE